MSLLENQTFSKILTLFGIVQQIFLPFLLLFWFFPPFLPSLFHIQHRQFTKRITGVFLRMMVQKKRKGTAALGCFTFTNPNQEASVPSHATLQSCLVLKTTTKPQNYSATAFPKLSWNNWDIEHSSALDLVFFLFTCVLLKNNFCKADLT